VVVVVFAASSLFDRSAGRERKAAAHIHVYSPLPMHKRGLVPYGNIHCAKLLPSRVLRSCI
jgi:hypothetical protein